MFTSALARQSDQSKQAGKHPYLKFQLYPQTPAVFAMRYVQEALTLPVRQLTPMPNMPACMLGLMNQRSRVFWVIDLAQLLGLSPPRAVLQQYSLVIIQANSIPLGLAVQQVEGINWLDMDEIQSPLEQVTPSIVPYLSGCILQQQEFVLVLDAAAVVQSPVFQSY